MFTKKVYLRNVKQTYRNDIIYYIQVENKKTY